jgi:hypothetical protein
MCGVVDWKADREHSATAGPKPKDVDVCNVELPVAGMMTG